MEGEKVLLPRRKICLFLAAFLALSALAVLLIRPLGVWRNARRQNAEVDRYRAAVEALSEAEIGEIKARAVAYNQTYAEARPYIWAAPYGELARAYPTVLAVPGTEAIGYLEISKIGVRLPIYPGEGEENLRRGCGHAAGSSLPIGGGDGHAVLLSHRDMATAVTFERLGELETGDRFSVTVLDETRLFSVVSIREVNPERPEDYMDDRVEEGKQLCTLVTCTQDGQRRLLVRGEREG